MSSEDEAQVIELGTTSRGRSIELVRTNDDAECRHLGAFIVDHIDRTCHCDHCGGEIDPYMAMVLMSAATASADRIERHRAEHMAKLKQEDADLRSRLGKLRREVSVEESKTRIWDYVRTLRDEMSKALAENELTRSNKAAAVLEFTIRATTARYLEQLSGEKPDDSP